MDTLKIGNIINEPQNRDAVHMAICPVEAGEDIRPGHHIGLKDGKATTDKGAKRIGIADPFLTFGIMKGQKFWLFLYPGSITSLRHDWTHPEIPVLETVKTFNSASQKWISDFADRVGIDYDVLMEGAATWVSTAKTKWGGEYLCLGGLLEGESVPDEFWPHYENVTGTEVPEEQRSSFFTCSC